MNINLIKSRYQTHSYQLFNSSLTSKFNIYTSKDFNKLCLIKFFHSSIVLNVMENPNTPKGKDVLKELDIPVTDGLLEELEILVTQSELTSSFSEAFPNYYETYQQNYSNRTISQTLGEVTRNTGELTNDSPILSETLLAPVIENPRTFAGTELFNSNSAINLLNLQSIVNGNFNALLNRVYESTFADIPNQTIGEAGPSTVRPNSVLDYISYENGILSINLNNTTRLFQNSLDFLRNHSDQIETAFNGYIIPSISHLPHEKQVKLLIKRGQQTAYFSDYRAVFVTLGLTLLSTAVINHFRVKYPFSLNFILGSNDKENSSFILLTVFKKLKGPNWLKYLILIFITIVVLIITRFYLFTVVSYLISTKFFIFKLILSMIGCTYILYNLLSLIILLKFSFVPDKKIIIPNYLPNKIKIYLLELKEISKFKEINYFIYNYAIGILFSIIYLILFLSIMAFVSTFF